ncbi:uncharacterized protein LOC124164279 [Ischnura elegans]|uniref:uncharacterized protein LOC124164279 n=1 Tax=Ischnura elegans TaxID=197161 RepID=UPI001ED88139|nr:uncharacterized protein LOC124164279 [Ischnura elegans]
MGVSNRSSRITCSIKSCTQELLASQEEDGIVERKKGEKEARMATRRSTWSGQAGKGSSRKEEEEEEELAPPLSASELDEILSGEMLSGEHINKFQEILSAFTDYNPRNVFFIGAMEFIKPVRSREHLQILPGRAIQVPGDITHWICVYHDGAMLHVYDSLNSRSLSQPQEEYLKRLFPCRRRPPLVFEHVQSQPNGVDCGVFAAAFATSVAFGRDPVSELYIHSRMRPHLHDLLCRAVIEPFPTFAEYDEYEETEERLRNLKL